MADKTKNESVLPERIEDLPFYGALKNHLDALWRRAKLERVPRENKWARNRITSEGETLGTEGAAALPDEPDGAWRMGDKGFEKLRVARQKVLAARSTIGDAVYRGNRVPFFLKWSDSALQDDLGDDPLEELSGWIEQDMISARVPDQMRTSIEAGAAYGEYWLHGAVGDGGNSRVIPLVESVSCHEMYFDDAGANTDLQKCEYVIRRRWMTKFEFARMAAHSPGVIDLQSVAELSASSGYRGGGAGGSESAARHDDSGRSERETELLDVREVWAFVPQRVFDPDSTQPSLLLDDDPRSLSYESVMAIVADDRLISMVRAPGPRPYWRGEWDRDPMRAEPQGVLDSLEGTQATITGALRAWIDNIRRSSRIVLAGHRDLVRQDVKHIIDGVDFLDLEPDIRNVNDAITQFKLDDLSRGLTDTLEFLLGFADLESNIPRLLQGQQPVTDSTAYELRQRLAASGKYLNEIVRRHDGGIVWVVSWFLYVYMLRGDISDETRIRVQPRGFASFQELIAKLEGLLRLLSLGAQSPKLDGRLNHGRIVRQVAQADDLDPSEVLLSDEEYAKAMEAEAKSEERALALSEARAKVAKTEAEAERARADAQAKRGGGDLERARFIRDVEREAALPEQQQQGPGVASRE